MIIYIKELDKNDRLGYLDDYPMFIKKIVLLYMRLTNNCIVINIDESNQKFLICNKNNKTFNKINKKIQKKKMESKRKIQVVLSENLKEFKDKIKNANVLNGKSIYKRHLIDVINYVLKEIPLELIDIHILSNSYCNENVNMIKRLVREVKLIKIITKEVDKFQILEELLSEEGFMITVSNNKRKSLKNAKVIVNLDFDNAELRKYSIFRDACIINLTENTINTISGFEGVLINNIDIKLPKDVENYMKENDLLDNFKKIELYESYNNDLKKIEIIGLCGNNGVINEKERLNVQKILTK